MDSFDISLVKEETGECIETKRESINEFDISVKHRIKTEEESNSAANFNDSLNYETGCFQTSNVKMKSKWDGFLPIKEQIKDEFNTSDYEDEMVNTKLKFSDSSLEKSDSDQYYCTPENKSQIKLEEQSSSSSEILQSKLLVQVNSDFNIEFVKKNQELSSNVLNKKEYCSNFLIQGSSFVLNSIHKVECIKENHSDDNKNTYTTQACVGNYLTGEDFKCKQKDKIICKHDRSGEFCISHEANNRKCKSRNCAKYLHRSHYAAHRGVTKCKTENRSKHAQVVGHCIAHGGGKKCKTEYCTKYARAGGHCIKHGGGKKCKTENCIKYAQVGGHCTGHGGGNRCKTENCFKSACKGGHCITHGGGKKCITENCSKTARLRGHCIAHGGRKICKTENCSKPAYKEGYCIAHGGMYTCNIENCSKKSQVRGHCCAHGGVTKCKNENCIKNAHRRYYKCKTENCGKQAQVGGHCVAHGGGKKCITENCGKLAQLGGHCIAHGGGRKCKTEYCTKYARAGGHCIAHGGGKNAK